jgi:WD40 repeat protein
MSQKPHKKDSPDSTNGSGDPSGIKLRMTLRSKGADHVTKIGWSPDGKLLAIPTQSGNVELWQIAPQDGIEQISKTISVIGNRWATSVAWSPDSEHLAVGSGDGNTRIWSVRTGLRLKTPENKVLTHRGSLVVWLPISSLLATATLDGTLSIGDPLRPDVLALQRFSGAIKDMACSADGKLAVAVATGDIHILADNPKGRVEPRYYVRQPGVRSLAWSPDGRVLAAGSSHGTVSLFDTAKKFKRTELEGHTRYVRILSFSADNNFLASKSDDDTVRIWNLATSRTIILEERGFDKTHFVSGKSKPGGLAFHPTLPILASL